MDFEPTRKAIEIGDLHIGNLKSNPLRPDAFELTDDEKISLIERNFREIMVTLGLDLDDDSLSGTPYRMAKMYVKEVFGGLNPAAEPDITLFENKYSYREMLVEKNITLYSTCEHHFVPITGKVHVGYISSGKVIGLSKIHRIVKYFARRPQVQERLTTQIAEYLGRVLETDDVAVVIDADHLCVAARGVQDHSSSTVTSEYRGKFRNEETRAEFLKYLSM